MDKKTDEVGLMDNHNQTHQELLLTTCIWPCHKPYRQSQGGPLKDMLS